MLSLELLISTIVFAALVSAGLIWSIMPSLGRYALSRPNSRSSHQIPTPQGAGMAVIAATLAVAGALLAVSDSSGHSIPAMVFAATSFIALVGFIDDIRPIPVIPRLLLQALCVSAVLYSVPGEFRIVSSGPLWIERGILMLAGVWFVNLVNFMDGLDWVTVAEVVPISGALVLLGSVGQLPLIEAVVSAALCGALLGFAPFNRPIAKVFLGDVGSLPIGLLLGWCLLGLAFRHHVVAALLLPLYYLIDATATLIRRLLNRERVWTAHRSHFYQRATDNGYSVSRVVGEVFSLNIMLAAMAIASALTASAALQVSLLVAGAIAVTVVLLRFSTQR